jgi:uncharacterized protein
MASHYCQMRPEVKPPTGRRPQEMCQSVLALPSRIKMNQWHFSCVLRLPSMKRVSVRRSPIHGNGVFALCALRAGERIFEYRGLVTICREATRHYVRRDEESHTFLFGLSDGRVIDGGRGGTCARWLNHPCSANCEAVEEAGRVDIKASHPIEWDAVPSSPEVQQSGSPATRASLRLVPEFGNHKYGANPMDALRHQRSSGVSHQGVDRIKSVTVATVNVSPRTADSQHLSLFSVVRSATTHAELMHSA